MNSQNTHKTIDTLVKDHVVVRIDSDQKYTAEVQAGKHQFIADEPETLGGKDFGPDPYQLLLSSLGACTAMTIKMYAERKNWDVGHISVQLNHSKKLEIDENGTETGEKIDLFERKIQFSGDLDEKQRGRLLEIANRCPVHKTLSGTIEIESELV